MITSMANKHQSCESGILKHVWINLELNLRFEYKS